MEKHIHTQTDIQTVNNRTSFILELFPVNISVKEKTSFENVPEAFHWMIYNYCNKYAGKFGNGPDFFMRKLIFLFL